MDETNNRKQQIAIDIIELSIREVLLGFRFLNFALDKLHFQIDSHIETIGTDGEYIYYNPNYIIKSYRSSVFSINRAILHMVYHCLLKHPFIFLYDKVLWDIATDIAVGLVLDEIDSRYLPNSRSAHKEIFSLKIIKNTPYQTAQYIYKYLQTLSNDERLTLARLYHIDDHSPWPSEVNQLHSNKRTSKDKNADEDSDTSSDERSNSQVNMQSKPAGSLSIQELSDVQNLVEQRTQLAKEWSEINRSVQMDMETFHRKQGDIPGTFLKQLKLENRDRYDYTKFLYKFAVLREEIKMDQDSFDYIFYMYGLENYGNLALIEPLEYKDSKKIYEFAIVIDTSGSVIGGDVQKFLNKTYSILKTKESFDRRMKLHIIQSDAGIQDDVVIHNIEEFESYTGVFTVKGGGGTDFRPAFEYIDQLIAEKHFSNLKGMIYFTDGYGTYPTKRPNYETAFIFLKDNYTDVDVPPWAIKLVLDPENL